MATRALRAAGATLLTATSTRVAAMLFCAGVAGWLSYRVRAVDNLAWSYDRGGTVVPLLLTIALAGTAALYLVLSVSVVRSREFLDRALLWTAVGSGVLAGVVAGWALFKLGTPVSHGRRLLLQCLAAIWVFGASRVFVEWSIDNTRDVHNPSDRPSTHDAAAGADHVPG